MADAEHSQSRCLIWGTETQRMNVLQHNTRIWSLYSLRKQDKWILPSAQLRVMLISRHLKINSVNAINLGRKESHASVLTGLIYLLMWLLTGQRWGTTLQMIPDLYIFWKICEWFFACAKYHWQDASGFPGIASNMVVLFGTFCMCIAMVFTILCVFGNFCAVVRVFWMVVRVLLEYYSWLLTGLKAPLQIFVIFWSLHPCNWFSFLNQIFFARWKL